MSNGTTREKLASGLGFLLVSAGCAVGLGNVWRFPYIVGQYGGALFVGLYILLLLVFGLPMMVTEFAVGRASMRTLPGSYRALAPQSKLYRVLGPVQISGNYLLMMFYTTVAGWLLAYPVYMVSGLFTFTGERTPVEIFTAFTGSPWEQLLWMTAALAFGVIVCAFGVQKGVERVTKWMMATLFLLLVGLAVYVLTLPGAMEGVSFYLKPDMAVLKEHSFPEILFAALGQSFFTLSIGIGSMSIFGSYTSRERRLAGEAAKIISIDTSVALLSGLIIFPACAAYNVAPGQGPGLIFFALPEVFAAMPYGQIVGIAFFVLLCLAALTTIVAVYENIVATQMDSFGATRKKAIATTAPLLWVLSMPCALGFGLLSGLQPLGEGSTILDLEDFILSNLILPLGALSILIFCTSRRFWGWERFLEEANTGKGLKLAHGLYVYMRFVLPVILVAAFIYFILDKFGFFSPAAEEVREERLEQVEAQVEEQVVEPIERFVEEQVEPVLEAIEEKLD